MRRFILLLILQFLLASGAYLLYDYLFPSDLGTIDWANGFLRGLVFLAGGWLRPFEGNRSTWVKAIERTFLGMGLNMFLGGVLVYIGLGEPFSMVGILAGGVLAGALVALVRAWGLRPPASSVLLVGSSPLGVRLAQDLGSSMLGIVSEERTPEAGSVLFLGNYSSLDGVLSQHNPRRILVSRPDLWPEQAETIAKWKQGGKQVESLPSAYENLYLRICAEGGTLEEILNSPALVASPAMMSLQATYSNLVGLTFLITLSPLMALLAILSRVALKGGPILDRVECAGFQGTPFQRLYFRTRSEQTGELTWIGSIIVALRLTGLPQLINLVRGEMAMFGPAPARMIFSEYLRETIPGYAHRLTMRPGLMGWAQVHMRVTQGLREEVLQFEYDLYYIKECSPSFDLEILLRTILRIPHIRERGSVQ